MEKSSPARLEYTEQRLRAASFFMFVHAAVPTLARLYEVQPDAVPDPLKDIGFDTREIWEKFSSDFTPTDMNRFCDEVWHCRNSDALQQYLEQMLFAVFTQRPETLRSSEQVRVLDVLRCADMDGVVLLLAEKKVASLAYQGFDALLDYLRGQLGLDIDADAKDLSVVKEAFEVRNLIVHNRCMVNKVFLRRTGRKDLGEGVRFPIDRKYVMESGRSARNFVEALDASFLGHFKLTFGPASQTVSDGDA